MENKFQVQKYLYLYLSFNLKLNGLVLFYIFPAPVVEKFHHSDEELLLFFDIKHFKMNIFGVLD